MKNTTTDGTYSKCVSILIMQTVFLFVSDADAEIEGAPGAPLDVRCLDANKDYIIVTWKQPAVDGGNSILGYFVDRLVVLLLCFTL